MRYSSVKIKVKISSDDATANKLGDQIVAFATEDLRPIICKNVTPILIKIA